MVSGRVPLSKEEALRDKYNVPTHYRLVGKFPNQEEYSLCRCGASEKKPFCRWFTHEVKFNGTETASKRPFIEEATRIRGQSLDLLDNKALCAGAQFCHRAGGIWELVQSTNDPKSRNVAVEIAGQCPRADWSHVTRVEPQSRSSWKRVSPSWRTRGGTVVDRSG